MRTNETVANGESRRLKYRGWPEEACQYCSSANPRSRKRWLKKSKGYVMINAIISSDVECNYDYYML